MANCGHAIEDVTDKNSASPGESYRSLSVCRVVPILEVLRLLSGNEGVVCGANFPKNAKPANPALFDSRSVEIQGL